MPFVITYYNIQVAPSGGFVLHFLLARLYILTFKISKDHCTSHGFHSFFPPLFIFLISFSFFFFWYHTFTTKHFAPVVNFLNADFTP